MPRTGTRTDGAQVVARAAQAARLEGCLLVYFAHSLRDYGTSRAATARAEIPSAFPPNLWTVLDPEDFDGQDILGVWGSYEDFYRAVVTPCAAVAVLEHEAAVGKGVHDEVSIALQAGKAVRVLRCVNLEIRGGRGYPVYRWFSVLGVRRLPGDDWKLNYAVLDTPGDVAHQHASDVLRAWLQRELNAAVSARLRDEGQRAADAMAASAREHDRLRRRPSAVPDPCPRCARSDDHARADLGGGGKTF